MRPKIQIISGHIQGYGGPGRYWSRGVYRNHLLFDVESTSETDVAVRAERERVKWEREWPSITAFNVAVEKRPLASRLCSNCGKHTLDGSASCLERLWCTRPACEAALAAARVKYAEDQRIAEANRQKKAEEDKRARIARIDADTARAFHWQKGWYFSRLDDGSVRMMHRETPTGEWLRVDLTIPPNEWASIVRSLQRTDDGGGPKRPTSPPGHKMYA